MHGFEKPNDKRALDLMDHAAQVAGTGGKDAGVLKPECGDSGLSSWGWHDGTEQVARMGVPASAGADVFSWGWQGKRVVVEVGMGLGGGWCDRSHVVVGGAGEAGGGKDTS